MRHHVRNRCSRAASCVLMLAAIGCGHDTTEARPTFRIQTSGPGPISSLADDQLRSVCGTYDAYVETYISFDAIAYIACLPAAIVLGGNERGCQQQLDQCMALFPDPIAIQAQVSDQDVCVRDLQACNASVSAVEGCANVNLDLALDIIDNWSCSGAAASDLQAKAARAMDTVQVCGNIDATCNHFASLSPN